MPVNCHQCGKLIKTGRADKKFCDAGCKDAYYNARKVLEHAEIKKTDLLLKRNRRILKSFYKPGKEILVSRIQLLKLGFEFDYHTHFVVTKLHQHTFIFCYDYGYREVEKDKFQVIEAFRR